MADFPYKWTAVYFCCASLKYCHRDSHFDFVVFIIPFTLFLLFLFHTLYFAFSKIRPISHQYYSNCLPCFGFGELQQLHGFALSHLFVT